MIHVVRRSAQGSVIADSSNGLDQSNTGTETTPSKNTGEKYLTEKVKLTRWLYEREVVRDIELGNWSFASQAQSQAPAPTLGGGINELRWEYSSGVSKLFKQKLNIKAIDIDMLWISVQKWQQKWIWGLTPAIRKTQRGQRWTNLLKTFAITIKQRWFKE